MNDVERMILEQMETDRFHSVINDSFSFADSLIDQRDLDRINKEDE